MVTKTHEEYEARKAYEYEAKIRAGAFGSGGHAIHPEDLIPSPSITRGFTTVAVDEDYQRVSIHKSTNVEVDKDLMMRLIAHVRTLQETVDEALRNK
jgi:hypothetical protein